MSAVGRWFALVVGGVLLVVGCSRDGDRKFVDPLLQSKAVKAVREAIAELDWVERVVYSPTLFASEFEVPFAIYAVPGVKRSCEDLIAEAEKVAVPVVVAVKADGRLMLNVVLASDPYKKCDAPNPGASFDKLAEVYGLERPPH